MTTLPVQPESPPITSGHIETKLRRAWSRQRLFVHMRGLFHVVIWFVFLTLATFMLDWLLLLPPVGRLVLVALNVGLLIFTVWRYWLRYLRSFDPVRVALQVEREHPSLCSVLVSYVQFAIAGNAQGNASPSLIRAVQRQAEEITLPIDFRRIVDFAQLRKLLMQMLLALLLMVGAVLIWTPHFGVLLERLTNPFATITYPTRTTVDPDTITGNVTLKQGESVEIAAVAGGRVPQTGALMARAEGGTWERVNVNQGEEHRFAHQFAGVYQSFEYQWRIGDYRSSTYQVTVVKPPQVVEVVVDQQFPAYINRTREQSDSLNMQVPQGTELTWRVRFDRPLRTASMIKVERFARPMVAEDDDAPTGPVAPTELTDVQLEAAGRVLTATFQADESFNYRFAFTDFDHGHDYDEPVQYYVHVSPDAPPVAELLEPRQMQQIGTLGKQLDLKYRLADDYGLKSVAIVYSVNDIEEQRLEIGVFDNMRLVEDQYSWRVRDAIRGLREGDVIAYAIEVTDNYNGDSPNVGRSVTQTLTIVSVAEYQRYIFERVSELGRELETVHEIETEGSRAVEDLKRQTPPGSTPD